MRMNVITCCMSYNYMLIVMSTGGTNNTENSIMLSAMTSRDPNTSSGSAQNMNIMDYEVVVVFNVVG